MKKVYEKIRELREQLHLSQGYVADQIGVSRSTFTQMENGKRKIFVEDLQKLCELFGVSADLVMNDEEMKQPTTMFARSFEKLDENDQAEIMNLIRFKEQMKEQRAK